MGFHRAQWRQNAAQILKDKPYAEVVTKTFFGVLEFAEENEWVGACHAISAVSFVLLKKQSVDANLCLGEVSNSPICFNHSWIEIDGEVFDVAIYLPLVVNFNSPPIIASHDVDTLERTSMTYGSHSGIEDDPVAAQLRQIPFRTYMDNFDGHKEGLWGLAEVIGRRLGIAAKAGKLKKTFADAKWVFK